MFSLRFSAMPPNSLPVVNPAAQKLSMPTVKPRVSKITLPGEAPPSLVSSKTSVPQSSVITLPPVKSSPIGFKELEGQRRRMMEKKRTPDPPKPTYAFSYTPDVLVKNSDANHPEERNHALEVLLGPDWQIQEEKKQREAERATRKKKNAHSASARPAH